MDREGAVLQKRRTAPLLRTSFRPSQDRCLETCKSTPASAEPINKWAAANSGFPSKRKGVLSSTLFFSRLSAIDGQGRSGRRPALSLTPVHRGSEMKAFVAAAGTVFAMLVLVHVWRFAVEGRGVVNPFFIGVTVIAALFSVWAWRVYRKL